MKAKKDFQAEDSPTLETPQNTSESEAQPQSVARPSLKQRVLPWIIVSLVFFFIGAGLVFFTLYNSANKEAKTLKESTSQLSAQLSSAEVDLQKAKSDLGTAQSSLADTNNSQTKLTQASLVYKLEADVNAARVAVVKLDPTSARQALTIASGDLTNLSATSISQDSISGLQPQIDTALTNLGSDPQKALDALDTLNTNLLLISGSLK